MSIVQLAMQFGDFWRRRSGAQSLTVTSSSRRAKAKKRLRWSGWQPTGLFRPAMECLEERRLLAYTVTETGTPGNFTLVFTKAAADTANSSVSSSTGSGNTVQISDGIGFAGGPFTGVSLLGSVAQFTAASGVVHMKFDLSANNNQTNNLSFYLQPGGWRRSPAPRIRRHFQGRQFGRGAAQQ